MATSQINQGRDRGGCRRWAGWGPVMGLLLNTRCAKRALQSLDGHYAAPRHGRVQVAARVRTIAHASVAACSRAIRTAGRRGCKMTRRCPRSEEHTSELQSLMRISYAVFCLKKKNKQPDTQ